MACWLLSIWKIIPEYCREYMKFNFATHLSRRIFGLSPLTPSILVPACPELKHSGYQRPVWIALIAFFFSNNFVLASVRSAFWPFALCIPESFLPHFGLASFFFLFHLLLVWWNVHLKIRSEYLQLVIPTIRTFSSDRT